MDNTLTAIFENTVAKWPDRKMGEFINGDQSYTYATFGAKTREVAGILASHGVASGAKVAILSENMPHWTISFFAACAFRRVAVPILPGSTAFEVENIVNHSETEAIIVSKKQQSKISDDLLKRMRIVLNIEDFSTVYERVPVSGNGERMKGCDTTTATGDINGDSLATIIYTSGTSGNAKGVMLSHGNLYHSVLEAKYAQPAGCRDRWLSILPMAHAYEMAFGMLYPVYAGGSVHYLREMPTPSVLLPAMKKVHPTIICSVPLVAEKIHKAIMRKIDENAKLKWMQTHTPWLMYRLVGATLRKQTGGKVRFFGIGGAKLNPEVEEFLKKAHFNYAIGYGTTETAPLITNACVGRTKVGSIGVPAYGVEVDLDNVNPKTGIGEIIARGRNVMLGYFKDLERTASVLTPDGWYHTGDLASRDRRGRYYIKGRLGNMILGPSGENIYPEEIEQVINTFPKVLESLVIKRGKQLVALVELEDTINARLNEAINDRINELAESIRNFVNQRVGVQSQIAYVQLMTEPFKKTATLKIRRYLYQ